MAHTRRGFLKSAALAASAAGLPLVVRAVERDPPSNTLPPNGQEPAAATPARLKPASETQVPTVRFGGVDISRLVVGCNPFYGFAHFNRTLSTIMREYYTAERVCDVLHQCNRFGINAYNYVQLGRAPQDLERFRAEGGRMHLIVQGTTDPAPIVAQWKPLAVYRHGNMTDRAFQSGDMASVREWCKKVRDTGVLVGVGTHKPEVIALVEEQGWDVDFYAGCVYNVTRTPEEWRRVLGGELPEMPSEVYVRSDPERMYAVMRRTKKPCFAYKILAAGRVAEEEADKAFQAAFAGIKRTDAIFVGMFPRVKDEVRENAERVCRILSTT